MSYSTKHIITSISSSFREHTTSGSSFGVLPFLISTPGVISLRDKCAPYFAGTITPLEAYSTFSCTEAATSTPVSDTVYYTEVVEVTNSAGTTALHAGSLYLAAQTYTKIGALLGDLQSGGGANIFAQFKRFTNGSSLTTLSASSAGSGHSYITASNITVSTADWYDIYISGSQAAATSSIRGVYYEV